jgi:hypothetical protein
MDFAFFLVVYVIDFFLPGIVGGWMAYALTKKRSGMGPALLAMAAAIGAGIAMQALVRVVSLSMPQATLGFAVLIVLRGFIWGLGGGLIGLLLAWLHRRKVARTALAES